MTSVDELEPPLPRPMPGPPPLWQPLISNPVLNEFCSTPSPSSHTVTSQAWRDAGATESPHARRFTDHPPVGAGPWRIRRHPFQDPTSLLFPQDVGKAERVANMPPRGLGDETKRSARGIQKSSFREALPRRDASWGPAPRDDHSTLTLHLLDLLGRTHQDPAAEIDHCSADA